MSKARGVANYRKYIIIEMSKTSNNSSITWSIYSIKYKKQYSYVVTYCLEEMVDIPYVVFIVSQDISPTGNKVPDREFYWSANYEFYSRFGV